MSDTTAGCLFSGIGGLDLGLERAGWTIAWQAEIDPFCCQVLAKHWPETPNLGDVTQIDWSTVDRPTLVAGGFPCQPVSDAGLKLAEDDERWLWPEMRRCIEDLRPEWVLIENVSGLRKRGLATVRDDLDSLGYLARPIPIAACELGAPHTRRRLFIVAHAVGVRCGSRRDDTQGEGAPASGQQEGHADRGGSWWADEPRLDRVGYGIPGRVDRIRGLGNAVVPQVAELLGRRIIEGRTTSQIETNQERTDQ